MASSMIPTTHLEGMNPSNEIYSGGGSSVTTLSWTATEDCWVYIYNNSTNTGGASRSASIDGKVVFCHIGTITSTFLPLKKGQVLAVSGNPIYSVKAYSLLR